MKMQHKKFFSIILMIVISPLGYASISSSVTSSDRVTKLIDDVMYRYEGKTQISQQTLTTCAYRIRKGSIKCDSTPRRKTLKSVTKKFGEDLRDSKGFTLIVAPVSDTGISILQYDYYLPGKDTDQWLYLPEIGSVKRVASADDAPKSGSLFGSEFSLEDLEKPKLERYKWEMLEKQDRNGTAISIVEQVPAAEYTKRTNYSKRKYWIDTERLLILKTEYYAWNGELEKVSYGSDIKKISGIWTVTKTVMRNVQSKRISVLTLDDVKYNLPVSDDMLEIRVLNDAVFQNSMLKSLDDSTGS